MFTTASARISAEAVLRKGHELGLGPLTAAVLEPGGHLAVLDRDDGSGIVRAEIATGKACALHGVRAAGLQPRVDGDRPLP